jgi:hypothetical protein
VAVQKPSESEFSESALIYKFTLMFRDLVDLIFLCQL